jgi:putative SOS response-associated peptidase YedK
MPAILAPEDFDRWLGTEPDPRELLRPPQVAAVPPITSLLTGRNKSPSAAVPL